jgi:hypothetical protein
MTTHIFYSTIFLFLFSPVQLHSQKPSIQQQSLEEKQRMLVRIDSLQPEFCTKKHLLKIVSVCPEIPVFEKNLRWNNW